MRTPRWLGIALVLSSAPQAQAANVDVILKGGRVFTSDPAALWAEAVAIQGERVVAVGRNAEVLRLAGRNTRVVDLGGRLVVPGFNDAHVHSRVFHGPLVNSPDFVPGPGPTLQEMLDALAAAAQEYPEGTWLYGFVGEAMFQDPTVNRFALDAVTPRHPVFLMGWQGPHQAWVNTAGLAAAGIPEDAPDPLGGWYGRMPDTGLLDGTLFEYAGISLVARLTDAAPLETARAATTLFASQAAALGITSIQDMPMAAPGALPEVMAGLDLPIRVRNICLPAAPGDACPSFRLNRPGSLVTWGGYKRILDGTPVERNAAVLEPYSDAPSWSGAINFDQAFLISEMRRGLLQPWAYGQRVTHAIGDGAIEAYFDALEAAAPAWVWRLLRPRLEHGDTITPEQIARAHRLGVVIVQNPTHLALPALFQARFGPERFARAQPLKSLLRAGIPLAIGSDGTSQPMSPFLDLMMAVLHPANPAEALTLEEAVIAHTHGAAYAEFEEHRKGTLASGKLADLAVLSQDIFQVPIEALPATRSVLTLVGGKVVYESGELAR